MSLLRVVPALQHLRALTGEHGLFEHPLYEEARETHGYTTDDNGRALVVLARLAVTSDMPIDMQPYPGFRLVRCRPRWMAQPYDALRRLGRPAWQ